MNRLSTINRHNPIKSITSTIIVSGTPTNATLEGTGTYKVYSFKNTAGGSITLNGSGNVYYVIVGGGGSGAKSGAGGGGGNISTGTITQTSNTVYTITVGAGGGASGSNANGNAGSLSRISYDSTNLTANGGGGSISTTGGTTSTTKNLTGLTGVTESGNSTPGTTAFVASITGYTITITSPAFTGKYGGGGQNTASYNNSNGPFGSGWAGTSGTAYAGPGQVNTGGGGGFEASVHPAPTANGGGSGIVLLFYRV